MTPEERSKHMAELGKLGGLAKVLKGTKKIKLENPERFKEIYAKRDAKIRAKKEAQKNV